MKAQSPPKPSAFEDALLAELLRVHAELRREADVVSMPGADAGDVPQRSRHHRTAAHRAFLGAAAAVVVVGAVVGGIVAAAQTGAPAHRTIVETGPNGHTSRGVNSSAPLNVQTIADRVAKAIADESGKGIEYTRTAFSDVRSYNGWTEDNWTLGLSTRTELFRADGGTVVDATSTLSGSTQTGRTVQYVSGSWSNFSTSSSVMPPGIPSVLSGGSYLTSIMYLELTNQRMEEGTQRSYSLPPNLALLGPDQLKVVGQPVIDGQRTIELSSSTGSSKATVWIDSTTFLPVRESSVTPSVSFQTNIEWLAPTAANRALLNVPIPAGFKERS